MPPAPSPLHAAPPQRPRLRARPGRWSLLAVLLAPLVSAGAEQPAPWYAAARATLAAYRGSAERDRLASESLSIGRATATGGAGLGVKTWRLTRLAGLGSLSGLDATATGYGRRPLASGWTAGLAGALSLLSGTDGNTDGRLVPYGALTLLAPDASQAFDAGCAAMRYGDARATQLSATWGIALAERYVWAQTRLYLNRLEPAVQDRTSTLAVEERLTWYARPPVLSLNLSAFTGNRVYGYDPDLAAAYTLPDIQRAGGGLGVDLRPGRRLGVLLDVTHETYEKRTIGDRYGVTYGTAGLTLHF